VGGTFYGDLELDEDDPDQQVVSGSQSYCENNNCWIGSDVFVAKYTPDGVLIWGHSYGDDYYDTLLALEVDSAGRIALSGTFRNVFDLSSPNPDDGKGPSGPTDDTLYAQGCDAFLAELDGDGNYLWSTSFGTNQSQTTCQRPSVLAFAENDDVILSGGYWGKVTLTGDAADELPRVNSQEVLLARFTSSGDHVFSHGWANNSNQWAEDLVVTPDGGFLMIGSFGDALPFDPAEPFVSNGSGDVFVARFDAAGNYVEGRSYGDHLDQRGHAVALDEQGRITLAGRFTRTIDFGAGELETTTRFYGDFDAFLVQLDASFSVNWQLALGSTEHDAALRLGLFCDGAPVVAGEYGEEATLSTSGQLVGHHGGRDLWLGRVVP
jgi:hypothetical protein